MYTKYFQFQFSVSFVRFRHFTPQSAIFTPFSVPISALSFFVLLGLSAETRENLQKIFKVTKTEIISFKKKVVSSA